MEGKLIQRNQGDREVEGGKEKENEVDNKEDGEKYSS
jgi:hypothetical protein